MKLVLERRKGVPDVGSSGESYGPMEKGTVSGLGGEQATSSPLPPKGVLRILMARDLLDCPP
jgi:hypothetical protein